MVLGCVYTVVKDPTLLVEGIAQGVSDAYEEEGIAYCFGYGAGEVAQFVVGSKLASKLKGGKVKSSAFGYMDADDALRYNQYWDDVAKGLYNNPYGRKLSLDEISRMQCGFDKIAQKNWKYEPGLDRYNNRILDYHNENAINNAIKGRSKTKLDYVTSNGLELEATPGKTTTVLGTYRSDTGAILDELGNVKSLDFGPRDGSFNLLNTPDELYVSPNQFWNEYNKPWLSNAIERNDIFKIATEPTWDNLARTNMYTGKIEFTRFGREYTYLRKHGYSFDSITKTMSR